MPKQPIRREGEKKKKSCSNNHTYGQKYLSLHFTNTSVTEYEESFDPDALLCCVRKLIKLILLLCLSYIHYGQLLQMNTFPKELQAVES